MGMLSDIFHKIFPADHPAVAKADAGTTGTAVPTAATGAPAAAPATPMPAVDVAAILKDKADKTPEKLNWQSSIVDLLKLLGLDSSLDSRKELAKELGYTGDTNDSATMNIWLHKEVMAKLAANGGQVPAGMR